MKLFSSPSGKHARSKEDAFSTPAVNRPAVEPRTPSVSRNTSPLQPQPAAHVPPSPQIDAAPVKEHKYRSSRTRFLTGYFIYIMAFVAIIIVGLTVLWLRMDAYERSRPYRAMDSLMSMENPEAWRKLLADEGVEAAYLDTLAFDQANYTKKLGEYTDEKPVYSVRFGKTTMLTAYLRKGEDLRFGYSAWVLDHLTPVDSGLCVYAPEGATVMLNGAAVGEEYIAERNAQNITLGPLEADRTDIPGLTKYVLNRCFTADGITVTDAQGNALALGMQQGKSYYYPPVTSGYLIEAPSAVTVTVNGIPLTEEYAEITRKPLEDFEGMGDSVPVLPADVTYVIDGLVAAPEIKASFADGTLLAPTEKTADRWTFRLLPDEALRAEQEERILRIFDAYIAFLGNRNADLYGNYRRYLAYLVPGSEAAQRAEKSLDSLYWVQGRDTTLEDVSLGDVIRYGDDCFTAWLDFTRRLLDGGEDNNSYLFIFVRYNSEWRVVRVMNKTSFIRS